MLTAIHKETDKTLYGPDISKEEGQQLKGLLIDPIFREPCGYVAASTTVTRRSHFRTLHRMIASEWEKQFIPDNEYFRAQDGHIGVNESPIHLCSKEYLRSRYADLLGFNLDEIILEQRIKMPCGRWRIADIAIGVPDGPNLVVEAQISPISLEYIADRISDYESLGIESHWYFGPKARNPEVLSYVEEFCLFQGFLDIERTKEEVAELS